MIAIETFSAIVVVEVDSPEISSKDFLKKTFSEQIKLEKQQLAIY